MSDNTQLESEFYKEIYSMFEKGIFSMFEKINDPDLDSTVQVTYFTINFADGTFCKLGKNMIYTHPTNPIFSELGRNPKSWGDYGITRLCVPEDKQNNSLPGVFWMFSFKNKSETGYKLLIQKIINKSVSIKMEKEIYYFPYNSTSSKDWIEVKKPALTKVEVLEYKVRKIGTPPRILDELLKEIYKCVPNDFSERDSFAHELVSLFSSMNYTDPLMHPKLWQRADNLLKSYFCRSEQETSWEHNIWTIWTDGEHDKLCNIW